MGAFCPLCGGLEQLAAVVKEGSVSLVFGLRNEPAVVEALANVMRDRERRRVEWIWCNEVAVTPSLHKTVHCWVTSASREPVGPCVYIFSRVKPGMVSRHYATPVVPNSGLFCHEETTGEGKRYVDTHLITAITTFIHQPPTL